MFNRRGFMVPSNAGRLASLAVASSLAANSVAYAGSQCAVHEDALNEIVTKYEQEFKQVENQAGQLSNKADKLSKDSAENVIDIDFDFTMREKRIVFDLPTVTMKERRIVFGLPKTTFKLRSIKFDIPKTRFVNKKTGQYPETFCTDTWIKLPFGGKTKGVPKCTVRWSDIITKVPEVYVETTEIKTKIPEFTWGNTEIILDIPEFYMDRQEWFLKIPEVTSVQPSVQRREIESEANSLTERSSRLQQSQSREVATATSNLYSCFEASLEKEKEQAVTSIENAEAEIESAILEMEQLGIDPSRVRSQDGEVNLLAVREDLRKRKAEAINQFNEALSQILQERASALELI